MMSHVLLHVYWALDIETFSFFDVLDNASSSLLEAVDDFKVLIRVGINLRLPAMLPLHAAGHLTPCRTRE